MQRWWPRQWSCAAAVHATWLGKQLLEGREGGGEEVRACQHSGWAHGASGVHKAPQRGRPGRPLAAAPLPSCANPTRVARRCVVWPARPPHAGSLLLRGEDGRIYYLVSEDLKQVGWAEAVSWAEAAEARHQHGRIRSACEGGGEDRVVMVCVCVCVVCGGGGAGAVQGSSGRVKGWGHEGVAKRYGGDA